MKRWLLVMLLILSIVSLATINTAGMINEADLRVSKLLLLSEGNNNHNDVVATVSLDNDGDEDFEDAKVTISIPELGVWRSVGRFDIKSGDSITKSAIVEMLEDAAPGEYDVRITISNDKIRRVKYGTVTLH